jgi:hypothetical protein
MHVLWIFFKLPVIHEPIFVLQKEQKLKPKLNRYVYVRFVAFTAVAMKNVVFWDVALCRSCVNGRFGGTYRLHLQGRKIRERRTNVGRWLQTEPPVRNNQLY